MALSLLAALRKGVRGLVYSSEKDAPFRVRQVKAREINATNVAEQMGVSDKKPVEEVAFGRFFGELTKVQKWHAEDDKAVVKRFQDLAALLRGNLTDLRVYKVGKTRVNVFILGKLDAENWAVLETDALET